MEKSGKKLENLVRLVEEVYKTNSDTEIIQNFKIKNLNDNSREIDLFIKSKINGYEINIAIECKEFARKVSVEKIEAFNSKCLRIPNINKRIFISEKGFQKDAIAAAKAFGIELYTFSEIKEQPSGIFDFPIKQMKPKLTKYGIVGIKFEKPISQNIIIDENSIFREESNGENLNMFQTYQLFAKTNWPQIMNKLLLQWMENNNAEQEIFLEVTYKDLFLLFNQEAIKVKFIKWKMNLDFNFIDTSTDIREISNLESNETKAKTLSFSLDNNKGKGTIVLDQNENFHFFNTSNNKFEKMKVLCSYDSHSKQIKFIDE